jgi:hypothetical protein
MISVASRRASRSPDASDDVLAFVPDQHGSEHPGALDERIREFPDTQELSAGWIESVAVVGRLRRKELGVSPTRSRNARAKCMRSVKPVRRAI